MLDLIIICSCSDHHLWLIRFVNTWSYYYLLLIWSSSVINCLTWYMIGLSSVLDLRIIWYWSDSHLIIICFWSDHHVWLIKQLWSLIWLSTLDLILISDWLDRNKLVLIIICSWSILINEWLFNMIHDQIIICSWSDSHLWLIRQI